MPSDASPAASSGTVRTRGREAVCDSRDVAETPRHSTLVLGSVWVSSETHGQTVTPPPGRPRNRSYQDLECMYLQTSLHISLLPVLP
ncbi:hypothetical protein CRUP_026206 [Coryphaenoides rupestris]|nr:hypothetical protein CRUP_026206 [Coryphaenoides rupestris]